MRHSLLVGRLWALPNTDNHFTHNYYLSARALPALAQYPMGCLCLWFQFMKFIKRVGDGEITIEDNQVIELSASQKAENWSDQYNTQTPTNTSSVADAWVGEFEQQQQQPPPPQITPFEQNWVHQYMDSSLAEVLKQRILLGFLISNILLLKTYILRIFLCYSGARWTF